MGEPAKMIVSLTVDELRDMIRGEVANAIGNKPTEKQSPYVDMQTIADHFRVSKATVHTWISKEACPYHQRGKVLRFELAAVEAWFRGRKTPALELVKG